MFCFRSQCYSGAQSSESGAVTHTQQVRICMADDDDGDDDDDNDDDGMMWRGFCADWVDLC